MARFKRYFAYGFSILIFLLILFTARNLFTDNRFIDKQTAIERVQLECQQLHSTPQEAPYNIKAELFTCSEVAQQISNSACNRFSPNVRIWIVSMDGLWFHYGPPIEDGSNGTPIPIHNCNGVMDAKTGDTILVSSK